MGYILCISFFVCFIMPSIMAEFVMRGMYAPVFTPFDDNGKIETSVLDDYGKYLSEKKVTGIIVADTTGEGPNLSEAEKKLLLQRWMRTAKKYKLQVIAQIGGGSQGEMINLAKYCNHLKVNAISVLPTVYFKPKTIQQVTKLLEAISKTAPSIPIQYIDYPKFITMDLDLPALFCMASERIPNFMGMTVDLATAVLISSVNTLKPYQTICIRDHVLISGAAFLGFSCFTSTVINTTPLAVNHAINRSMIEGNSRLAIRFQTGINNVSAQLTKQGNMLNTHKAATEIYTGIKLGDPRIPVLPVSDEARENIKAITDTIDAIIDHS